MIALFKVSVNLDGGAQTFDKGEHVLDELTANNDYIQLLISDGLIEVLKDDLVMEAVVVDTKTKKAIKA